MSRLSDAQLARIVELAPQTTIQAIAHDVSAAYSTVAPLARQIRRHEWVCPIRLVPCTECGEPLVMSPAHRVTAHVHCRAARHAREMRERWRAGKISKEKGTQRYRAWARRNLEKVAAKRERRRVRGREERQAMPPEAHLPRFTALNNTARRTWERTRQTAEHSGTPWSLEEDVYLIEHGPTRMVEVALDLGRTLYAVHCRLFRLRHAAAQEGRALEEMLGQRAQGGDAARGPA